MKRTPLNRIGKRGKINLEANRKLKIVLAGINKCEIGLEDCLKTWPLQFVHLHKRDWYYSRPELLSDRSQVVIGCQNCHDKIEHNEVKTEEVFKRLRGDENT